MSQDAAGLVLVMEDDPSVRRSLVTFLKLRGFAAVTPDSVDEALDAFRTQRVVAAIVDVRVGGGSGRDVVAAAPAEAPVIIFSPGSSESTEIMHLRPRTQLIEKPYSLVLLVETLEDMLVESTSQNLQS